jgi:hypothetical protein
MPRFAGLRGKLMGYIKNNRFFKVLKIFLLTAILVLHSYMPVSMADEPEVAFSRFDAFNLPVLAYNLSPALIRSFKEKVPGFMPLAKSSIVTLIDFSLPSTAKRLWTINLETGEILFNSLVAHGRNTGADVAQRFSNIPQSYQSSLGFYLTDQVYVGKHGNSLRLKGLEKNINDNAWNRAIVVHGADYVTESFIKVNGRLGRSQGCPAIPPEITEEFINTVKEGSLIFIYHPGYEKQKV